MLAAMVSPHLQPFAQPGHDGINDLRHRTREPVIDAGQVTSSGRPPAAAPRRANPAAARVRRRRRAPAATAHGWPRPVPSASRAAPHRRSSARFQRHPGLSSIRAPVRQVPEVRCMNACTWNMPASETSNSMRGSDGGAEHADGAAHAVPRVRRSLDTPPFSASSTLPRSATSFVGVTSSKRPSDAPLPANETSTDAMPAPASAASSVCQGRSQCDVTPWPITTSSARWVGGACSVGWRLAGHVDPLALTRFGNAGAARFTGVRSGR